VIGEAARHVSQEFRDRHPQIPWEAIVGMRHKIVHDYLDVDEDVVWDSVTQELRPLMIELERLVPPENLLDLQLHQDRKDHLMFKQQPLTAKERIRATCGMLKAKTSITKALLKERDKDKKREEEKLKWPAQGRALARPS